MDPGPKNQVSGACLRLADRGGGVPVGWGAAPPNTSLQLTLDVGGVGGAALWSPISPAPCVTLGKSLASWASVSYSSLVRLHNRTDTAQVLGTGSGKCRVLLQVTESQQKAWEAPAAPHGAPWKWHKQAWRSSLHQAGPERPLSPERQD